MATDRRSDLIVFAARRSEAVRLVDVLRDWSALGLLQPLHVVDLDAVRADDVRVPCTVIDDGRVRAESLQDALASRTRTDRARIVAVTSLGVTASGPTPQETLQLLQTLRNGLPSTDPVQIHAVGATVSSHPDPGATGWIGWHNVVIAPENSQSPAAGVSPLVDGDPWVTTHLAAGLCSVAGGWAAVPDSPFDGRQVLPSDSVVVVRSFTRHLSAAAVESELFSRLTTVEAGYPVPTVEGASALVVDDELDAVKSMSDALVAKHAVNIRGREREQLQRRPPRKIGAMEALKMFFTFLWQAIRNAPRAFLDSMVNRVSARAAGLVGGLVFGGDSEYAVVVNGVTADGSPASWAVVDEALENVSRRLTGNAEVSTGNLDLSDLWQDYVGAGMTLFDAGLRSQELGPRMSGGRRAVVTTPGRIAPDPLDTYSPPENVSAYIKDRTVAPYDLVGGHVLDRQLSELMASEPHVATVAREAQAGLRSWFERHLRSYTGRFGEGLANEVGRIRAEIAELVQALTAADQAAQVPDAIEEQQRRLGRRLKLVGLGAALLSVVTIVIAVLGVLAWGFAIIALVVIVVGWVISSTMMFMRGQRDLFALLHRREELTSQREVLRRNLASAVADLRRLTRAYRQYLDWTRAFGRFAQMPMGRAKEERDVEVLLGTGFPFNHRFGAARTDELVVDDTADEMRRDLFGVGWASGPWKAFIDDVPREMGPEAYRVREDTQLLFTDLSVSRQSLLTAWADVVQSRDTWHGARENLVLGVQKILDGTSRELSSRILAKLDSRTTDGVQRSLTYEEFISGLDTIEPTAGGSFVRSIFTDLAQSTNAWQVADTVVQEARNGLGRTVVVTQISQGFPPHALKFADPSGSADVAAPSPHTSWSDSSASKPIL